MDQALIQSELGGSKNQASRALVATRPFTSTLDGAALILPDPRLILQSDLPARRPGAGAKPSPDL